MLTVNSPFLAMNSLVPSSGSTREEALRCRQRNAILGTLLFSDGRHVGRQPGEGFEDDGLGRRVGFGDGRAVGLSQGLEIAVVDVEDDRTGLAGHRNQLVLQFHTSFVVHRILGLF